jgi:hypothetical protein
VTRVDKMVWDLLWSDTSVSVVRVLKLGDFDNIYRCTRKRLALCDTVGKTSAHPSPANAGNELCGPNPCTPLPKLWRVTLPPPLLPSPLSAVATERELALLPSLARSPANMALVAGEVGE